MDDLNRLAVDLSDAASITRKRASQVVQQAALNTSKSWQKDAKADLPIKRLAGGYSASIGYDLDQSGILSDTISAEIGPNPERSGFAKFGALDDPQGESFIGQTPSRSRTRAEKFAADDLEKGIQIAIDQTLQERGL